MGKASRGPSMCWKCLKQCEVATINEEMVLIDEDGQEHICAEDLIGDKR